MNEGIFEKDQQIFEEYTPIINLSCSYTCKRPLHCTLYSSLTWFNTNTLFLIHVDMQL